MRKVLFIVGALGICLTACGGSSDDELDTALSRLEEMNKTFMPAQLPGADFSFADLSFADLSYANLSGAYLRAADLPNADLTNADLSGADLSGADLSGADLSRADLTGVRLPFGWKLVRDE
jgi:uncharacterized protein YjbI with pentapeptide repeats